jgi:hypothetical protein
MLPPWSKLPTTPFPANSQIADNPKTTALNSHYFTEQRVLSHRGLPVTNRLLGADPDIPSWTPSGLPMVFAGRQVTRHAETSASYLQLLASLAGIIQAWPSLPSDTWLFRKVYRG